jgi:hypothetical protein
MSETAEPEGTTADGMLRQIAVLRQMIRQALDGLDAGDPDLVPEGDRSASMDSPEYAQGYRDAVKAVRGVLAWEPAPTSRKAVVDRAAVMLALEPGGMGTGHLEGIWEAAYAEAERDADARLLMRMMHGADQRVLWPGLYSRQEPQ